MFVPLHVKSDYSLGYGTASIEELVLLAAGLGYRSLALTDLENLYGQVRFHHQCRLHGIHAITGVELRPGFCGQGRPGSRTGRVVLLALDASGYRSLCRIVSRRRGGRGGAFGEEGADPLPLVQRYAEGLFALSDDPAVIDALLAEGRFEPGRLGLLAVRPGQDASTAQEPAQVASRLGVRLVADLDTVFLQPRDHPLHQLQLAIATGQLMAVTAKSAAVESPERWLRSPAETEAIFHDLPDALEASSEIARACQFELGAGEVTERSPRRRGGKQDHDRLARLCRDAVSAARPAAGLTQAEYRKRLELELAVFDTLGFSCFMLVVADILSYCGKNDIPVAVRGSAVSSLVLHLLGASPADPLAHGLLFERFLHAGKTAWPDVDIDLPWHRRDEVVDWVYQHFGTDRVAMVAAHHTFRQRSALREGLKAWGAPASMIEGMSRALPPDDIAPDADLSEVDFLGLALPAGEGGASLREEGTLPDESGLQEILPLIRRLVGRHRHVAVHPGGIIIERRPLDDLLPLEMAPKGVVITQYDLVAVAQLGLVKIDLLGNRCLSEVGEALTLAGWQLPIRLADIPAEDPATLSLIDRAQTIACFQLESPAMRSLLARLPVRRQSDLIAALALIRPGAASGEVKNVFVRRARGEKAAELAFPVLADRLSETYGLPIYEEDIMVLLSRSGGLSLADADEMRRGIVKSGGDAAALSSLQADFLDRAKHAFGEDTAFLARARRAWAVAARFAAYSFNKAHAASLALLAYYSAYLKAHHPLQFACAVLNHHQGLYPLRTEASEFVRMGLPLLGPHVNSSDYRSKIEIVDGREAVRVGLDKVKGLTQRGAGAILARRGSAGGYRSLSQFLLQVRLGSREVSALVLSGACDGLAPLEAEEYPFAHEAVLERLGQQWSQEDLDHLRYGRAVAGTEAEKERVRLYRGLVRARNELLYLEMHLSAHPMALLREEAARYGCLPISEAAGVPADTTVLMAAVVAALRRVPTRQGPLQFITFEDETGLMEAVVFPALYREIGEQVETPGPFLVAGKLRVLQGAVHLEVGELSPFHERRG